MPTEKNVPAYRNGRWNDRSNSESVPSVPVVELHIIIWLRAWRSHICCAYGYDCDGMGPSCQSMLEKNSDKMNTNGVVSSAALTVLLSRVPVSSSCRKLSAVAP